jgi:outer membrane receptor protein involved in Fe transport
MTKWCIILQHSKNAFMHLKQVVKLCVTLSWLLTYTQSTYAQTSIVGKITDREWKPIAFSNVLLFNQNDTLKLYKAVVADSSGFFKFSDIHNGNFLIKIQTVAFKSYSTVAVKQNGEDVDLGIIELSNDDQLLSAILIKSKRDIIQKNSKGFVVNADAVLSQQGGTAIDILRNTPTIFVDAESGITMRGKSPLILINGRNSKLTNLANIPASSIEKIEIITNPSAEYDAEAENGIVNILLKKGKDEGINGAFAIGTGYGAKGRFNSSALLNHKKNGLNLGIGYDNRLAQRARKATGNRINFNLPSQYFLTQTRNDDRQEATHNLRLNMEVENKKYLLKTEAIFSLENETNLETLFSTFEKQNRDFTSKNKRFSEEIRKDNIYETAITFQRKFTTNNKKLAFNATTSYNRGRERTGITTQYFTSGNIETGFPIFQKTTFAERSNITNFRLDYAQGLGNGIFETGYKTIFRFFDNDFGQEDKINGVLQPVPSRNGNLQFSEGVHAVYVQYRQKWDVWDVEMGLRSEQTLNNGAIKNQNLQFNNSYFNLFPSFNIGRKFLNNKTLRFVYGRRINRPTLGQLNPFVDITDSLTQRSGNPNLNPEIVNNVELSFSIDAPEYALIAKTYYRNGKNTILPFTALQSNGVLFTKLLNTGNTQTIGVEGIFSYTPYKVWQGNLSASLFNQSIKLGSSQAQVANKLLSWNVKWLNDINISKGARLQIMGVYNAPTATIQGTRIAVYNVDLAFQQKILKSNGRVGIIITDVFNTQQSGITWSTPDFNFNRTFKVDTRAILITFAYTFKSSFKESLMKNQFSND